MDEGLFRCLFEASHIPAVVFDLADFRVVVANDAALAFYRYERDDFLRLTIDQVIAPDHWDAVRLHLASGAPSDDRETLHVDSSGRILHVRVTARAIDIGDRRLRLVQVQDMSEVVVSRRRIEEHLRSLIDTVSATIRLRDPYTDRHQIRVSSLSGVMARELGLSESDRLGVTLAATLHDIGKVNLPSEILTYPGRLAPPAMDLVREHARTGHDLIAGLDFDWPIARMILEHHERLDGSGYPAGLRESEIHVGSSIIAVADTAEAMMSHRPYRSGLGLDRALEELQAGAGIRYDADAVAVCATALTDGTFELPSPAIV